MKGNNYYAIDFSRFIPCFPINSFNPRIENKNVKNIDDTMLKTQRLRRLKKLQIEAETIDGNTFIPYRIEGGCKITKSLEDNPKFEYKKPILCHEFMLNRFITTHGAAVFQGKRYFQFCKEYKKGVIK